MALEILAVQAESLDDRLHLDDALVQLAVLLPLDLARLGLLEDLQCRLGRLLPPLQVGNLGAGLVEIRLELGLLAGAKLDVVVSDGRANALFPLRFGLLLAVLGVDGGAAVRARCLAIRLVRAVAAFFVADAVVDAREEDAAGDVALVAAAEAPDGTFWRLKSGLVVDGGSDGARLRRVKVEDEVPILGHERVGILDQEDARGLARRTPRSSRRDAVLPLELESHGTASYPDAGRLRRQAEYDDLADGDIRDLSCVRVRLVVCLRSAVLKLERL